MNKYLILGKRFNKEIEGEEFSKDDRFFTTISKVSGMAFLFDKKSGTYVAWAKSVLDFEIKYDEIAKFFEKLVLTKKYHRNVKKFEARNKIGKVVKL